MRDYLVLIDEGKMSIPFSLHCCIYWLHYLIAVLDR